MDDCGPSVWELVDDTVDTQGRWQRLSSPRRCDECGNQAKVGCWWYSAGVVKEHRWCCATCLRLWQRSQGCIDLPPLSAPNSRGASTLRASPSPVGSLGNDSFVLEDILRRRWPESSRSGRRFGDLYSMLLGRGRAATASVLVAGDGAERHASAWREHFPNATIHVIERGLEEPLCPGSPALPFALGSVDVVFDLPSACATWEMRERSLHALWPAVRPGGYYMLESVSWDPEGKRGSHAVIHSPEILHPLTLEILQSHNAFFADTSLGHPCWLDWLEQVGLSCAIDRFHHNAHVVVVSRRVEPLPPVRVNYKSVAMRWIGEFDFDWRQTSNSATKPSLEELMYKFGTDKSRDDHKYSDVMAMIFEPIRSIVRNVMELGVATGQGVKVWHDYFDLATIHGLDTFDIFGSKEQVDSELADFPRARLYLANSQSGASVDALGIAPESLDVIIDDADHHWECQERTLLVLWPFLRPGGYYIIEDVEWDREGDRMAYPVLHAPESLHPATVEILRRNDAVFVDTALGHRAWDLWLARSFPKWALDRFSHNSHLVILRKRAWSEV